MRRNPNPNSKRIVSIARQYNDDIDAYRRFAEGRRNATRFTQELLWELYCRMKEYFVSSKENGIPVTIGKLCLALGISKYDLHVMRAGDFDYRLFQYMDMYGVTYGDIRQEEDEFFKGYNPLEYWIDRDGKKVLLMMYSEIMLRGIAYIEGEMEEEILEGKKPVGSIFYAKAVFGYSDSPERTGNQMQEMPRITDADGSKLVENIIEEEAIRQAVLRLGSEELEERTAQKLAQMKEGHEKD